MAQDRIQLSNLTDRELLILLAQRVNDQSEILEKVGELEIRLTEMETKFKVWAGVIGFIGSLAGSALMKILNLV